VSILKEAFLAIFDKQTVLFGVEYNLDLLEIV